MRRRQQKAPRDQTGPAAVIVPGAIIRVAVKTERGHKRKLPRIGFLAVDDVKHGVNVLRLTLAGQRRPDADRFRRFTADDLRQTVLGPAAVLAFGFPRNKPTAVGGFGADSGRSIAEAARIALCKDFRKNLWNEIMF